MNKKIFWALALILVVAAVVGFASTGLKSVGPITDNVNNPVDSENTICTMDAKICPDGSSVGRSGPKCEFAACPGEAGNVQNKNITWTYVSQVEKNGVPQTEVTAIIDGKSISVGTYEGSCTVSGNKGSGSQWSLPAGSISGVVCWYAGGGTSIDIFKNGTSLTIRKASIDEGSAETAGGYGPYKTIVEVK